MSIEGLDNITKILINTKDNYLYSPVAIFGLLSLLSQIVDGNTKKEILDALSINNEEAIRLNNELMDVFNVESFDVKSNLNASIWLNDSLDINKDNLKDICLKNKLEAFIGKMGSLDFDEKVHKWLNEKTNNLLKGSVSDIRTSETTYLDLFSTIYLKAAWQNPFDCCKDDIFNLSNSEKVKCKFLFESTRDYLYTSEKFKVISKSLLGCYYQMNVILPNEDIDDITIDSNLINAINGDFDNFDNKYLTLNIKIPKFNIKSEEEIISQIKMLGINEIFDANKANFSPLTAIEKMLCVSKINQMARVKINKKGLEAASAAMCFVCATGSYLEIPEEYDFFVDRPFIFSITRNNMPIFVGTIANPKG